MSEASRFLGVPHKRSHRFARTNFGICIVQKAKQAWLRYQSRSHNFSRCSQARRLPSRICSFVEVRVFSARSPHWDGSTLGPLRGSKHRPCALFVLLMFLFLLIGLMQTNRVARKVRDHTTMNEHHQSISSSSTVLLRPVPRHPQRSTTEIVVLIVSKGAGECKFIII
jgi:hypothetical protein